MLIKNNDIDTTTIINVPDTVFSMITYEPYDEFGDDDCSLYLIVGDRTILLRDVEYWCQGRPNLPYSAVGDLYEEIVDTIFRMVSEENLTLDISSIESKLLEEKYAKEWIEKGYVEVDATGNW